MRFVYTAMELVTGLIALLVITKILGKRQLNQITPFDFISAIILGELLGNGIYNEDIGPLYILSTLMLWGVLMLLIEILSQKYLKLRGFLEGNPSIIIRSGMIDRKELKKNRMDINELQNLLRQKDVFSVRDVEFGILESDGKLSILKKSNLAQPTVEDLKLPQRTIDLPVVLISDGEVLWDNLNDSGLNEQWLMEQLIKHKISDVKQVFYAEWEDHRGIHIVPQKKEK